MKELFRWCGNVLHETFTFVKLQYCNFFFAVTDLCDRPIQALFKTAGVQPGRLAHGPEEKKGTRGKAVGFIICSFKLYTTWREVVAQTTTYAHRTISQLLFL